MWGYWWGLTSAQIELLAVDQPLIVYDHKKDKKKGKGDKFKKRSEVDIAKTSAEWLNKYGGKEEQGIKFDFSGFSNNNKKE